MGERATICDGVVVVSKARVEALEIGAADANLSAGQCWVGRSRLLVLGNDGWQEERQMSYCTASYQSLMNVGIFEKDEDGDMGRGRLMLNETRCRGVWSG